MAQGAVRTRQKETTVQSCQCNRQMRRRQETSMTSPEESPQSDTDHRHTCAQHVDRVFRTLLQPAGHTPAIVSP